MVSKWVSGPFLRIYQFINLYGLKLGEWSFFEDILLIHQFVFLYTIRYISQNCIAKLVENMGGSREDSITCRNLTVQLAYTHLNMYTKL
jgi:hypothetical protein